MIACILCWSNWNSIAISPIFCCMLMIEWMLLLVVCINFGVGIVVDISAKLCELAIDFPFQSCINMVKRILARVG